MIIFTPVFKKIRNTFDLVTKLFSHYSNMVFSVFSHLDIRLIFLYYTINWNVSGQTGVTSHNKII